jgi:FkbM family methyltransferase
MRDSKRIVRVPLTTYLRRYVEYHYLRSVGHRVRRQNLPRMAVIAHDEIGAYVVTDGRYEVDLLKGITEWLIPAWIPDHRRKLALDIGANIGNHALAFSPLFARVLAFEPNPIALHLLRANIELNQRENIEVVPFGLGRADETHRFQTVHGNLGASRFTPSGGASLQIRQGDRFILEEGRQVPVGLIKIDVEGMEPQVLEGLTTTIDAHKPVVLFEVMSADALTLSREILASCGYRHFFTLEKRRTAGRSAVSKLFKRISYGADLFLVSLEQGDANWHSLIAAAPPSVDASCK